MALQLEQLFIEEKALYCPSLDDIAQGKGNSA